MTTHDFWHSDLELLEAYKIAYERNVAYTAWQNGARVFEAISKAIYNGFGRKQGQTVQQFSDWKDPIQMPTSESEENIDEVYLQQKIAENDFIRTYMQGN